jgi:hypothetical protein
MQLPLCLLDWVVTAYAYRLVGNDLAGPLPGWAMHCLDGLLLVGLPAMAAASTQQRQHAAGASHQPRKPSGQGHNSKTGASSSGAGNVPRQELPPPRLSAAAMEPQVAPAPPGAPAQEPPRSSSSVDSSAAVAGVAVLGEQGLSPILPAATGAPAGTAVQLTAPCHHTGSTAQAAAAVPVGQTTPCQQQLVPASLDPFGSDGWRGVPSRFHYTAVTRITPVNFKVGVQ